jgi:hypothetical protein
MEAIWQNQHPPDCKNAKFLISEGWAQGFGSEVHVIGVGLAIALNTKRVFVMNPEGPLTTVERDNSWQVRNSFCEAQGKKSMECYFEPWTSCSFEDALQGKTIAELKAQHRVLYFSDTDFNGMPELMSSKERTLLLESRGDVPLLKPTIFEHLLSCSPIRDTFTYHYWWRAISAAWLLRPNPTVLALMDKHRADVGLDHNKEQCVSIYVRRGDKHVEMKFVSVNVYLETAKMLWDTGLVPGPGGSPKQLAHNNSGLSTTKGVVFIGSEDSSVIENAKTWGQQEGWKIAYTNLFDRRIVSAGLNWSVQVQHRKSKAQKHHDLEYFSMLFNIDYHMRCNAFVCTMPSNFCRLIDELRATIGGKANRHFADVGESCKQPPCLDNQIGDLGW